MREPQTANTAWLLRHRCRPAACHTRETRNRRNSRSTPAADTAVRRLPRRHQTIRPVRPQRPKDCVSSFISVTVAKDGDERRSKRGAPPPIPQTRTIAGSHAACACANGMSQRNRIRTLHCIAIVASVQYLRRQHEIRGGLGGDATADRHAAVMPPPAQPRPGIGGGSVSFPLGRVTTRSNHAATFGDACTISPLSGIRRM